MNISGWYLSDKLSNPTKWPFPAGTTIAANGFLRVWASGRNSSGGGNYHTNFKITQTQASEDVVLANASGTVVDYNPIDVPNQSDHSWGRSPNGSANWRIFTTVTPNASNTATAYTAYATTPNITPASGGYTGSVSVSITTPDPGITLRYTNNGDFPTTGSTLYSGAFTVNLTRVIRAIAISSDPNILPSYVETNTYFVNVAPHTVKIISLSGAGVATLFNGTQSSPKGGYELFDENFVKLDEGYGELNKHGNDSWAYQQRGVDLIVRDQFGYDDEVEEQVFPFTPRNGFQRLILKAAANDNYPFSTGGAHIRDSYVHTLSQRAGLELDERTWEPCVVYVNGNYWGVYDIREKVDDGDFTQFYYNKDDDEIDFIKTWGGTWAEYGSTTSWNALKNYILTNNMAVPANYNYVLTKLNALSLADYIIINTHTVCVDWLNWNTAWWHSTDDVVKWRYTLWDMDATFDHYINYTSIPNDQPTASPCDPWQPAVQDPQGHTDILQALFQNPDFYTLYVNRYADLNNTYFTCDYMLALLDSMVAEIAPEMPRQIAKWGGTMVQWQNNVQAMRNFILTRCAVIDQGIADCFTVSGPYEIVIIVNNPSGGYVTINGNVIPDTNPWTGTYFGGAPITISATANSGYQFVDWEFNNNTPTPSLTNPNITVNLTAGDTIYVNFGTPTVQLTTQVQNAGMGSVTVNGITPSNYPNTTTYNNGTLLNITATPASNCFVFDHWVLNNHPLPDVTDPTASFTITQTDVLTAVFVPIPPPNCDDGICGTTDTYNTTTCLCEHTPVVPPNCNDNNCNTTDTYNATTCLCEHTLIPPPNCDDLNCGTTDTYNTTTCLCEHTPIVPPNCDDLNCGTTDTYNTTTCLCEHTPIVPPNCDDLNCGTTDTYNTTTCLCEHTPIVPPNCDDLNCGTTDTYNTTTCLCEHTPVTPLVCNDNNCNTTDTYNPLTCMCEYAPIPPPN
ncbi:hypothetical protein C7N43_25940, partial [Sphingobacteriales bacterium UPWRP_1]